MGVTLEILSRAECLRVVEDQKLSALLLTSLAHRLLDRPIAWLKHPQACICLAACELKNLFNQGSLMSLLNASVVNG